MRAAAPGRATREEYLTALLKAWLKLALHLSSLEKRGKRVVDMGVVRKVTRTPKFWAAPQLPITSFVT